MHSAHCRIFESEVDQAIALHKQAVMTDDAMFTDAGVAIDQVAANATRVVEIEVFREMLAAPCRSTGNDG